MFAREVKILKILGRSDRILALLNYFCQGEKFCLVHQFIEEDSTQFPFLYRNNANGVEMKYPADWKLAQSMQEQGVIAKLTPELNSSDAPASEVNLEVEPVSEESPEKYTTNAVYQITQLPHAKIIDFYPTNFAGGKGYKVIYTVVNQDNNLEQKYLQIWTYQGDT